MKINVLHIIWSLEKGGAERFLVSLVKNFDRSRFNSIVCCLNWKGEWAKELEEEGIKVIALNKRGKLDICVIYQIIRVIKQHRIDVVNTHLWAADTLGRIAAILAGVPVIVSTIHSLDIWKRWWHIAIDKLLNYRTDMFIAVSEAVKKHYIDRERIPPAKIAHIPNAIEIDKFKNNGGCAYLYDEIGFKENDFILVCIGRLSEEKGHKYLLEALSLLNGRYNIKLLVVGEGPLLQSLKSQVTSHKLEDKVIFTGQRKDIPEILNISDCLVLPSLYEGLPTCIIEAMASAKPVITTDISGNSELVTDRVNGFLVEPKNPKALALAIENLINLPDKGIKMGERGRTIAINNFSIVSTAKNTTNLFINLIKRQ